VIQRLRLPAVVAVTIVNSTGSESRVLLKCGDKELLERSLLPAEERRVWFVVRHGAHCTLQPTPANGQTVTSEYGYVAPFFPASDKVELREHGVLYDGVLIDSVAP